MIKKYGRPGDILPWRSAIRTPNFKKLLAHNDIDAILQLCENRMSIDPLDALMFMWGYADKEYRYVGDIYCEIR